MPLVGFMLEQYLNFPTEGTFLRYPVLAGCFKLLIVGKVFTDKSGYPILDFLDPSVFLDETFEAADK
jgi:hypothetical protein